ncbi:hypothetical protein KGD15_002770 [Escherichia coli]|uniref:hypothetical protein n=1 Tax=Escherichia coli TaxID=562 RepID=UPI000BE94F50|nr:hypothetical protein [Escherichia coli]EHM2893792.1 hypothetical protein [Escherichia coli]EHM2964148.1 hypothetical protein [Escherichia coli]EHM2978827.1 hypothetical protein [Escherichia coli]EHM2997858.1 hypothetical protein [Escherichia coli]EHM3183358.1 hypothetical protein [Escherichia coli]
MINEEQLEKEISELKKELIWHKVAISALIRQVVSPEDKVKFMKHFSCSSKEFFSDSPHPEAGFWVRQLFSQDKRK